MRNVFFLVAALLALILKPCISKAENKIISIDTHDISMIMSVNDCGEVLFHHFGKKISDPEKFLEMETYRRADYGTDPLAYTTMGGRNFQKSGLSVTHANGDINTDLKYVSHTLQTTSDSNVKQLLILLQDEKQLFEVELQFKAYIKENIITVCNTLKNKGTNKISLRSYYSSTLPIVARTYLLTHFYGDWAREMQIDHTLLTHGSKSIESGKGLRTTHNGNPSFLLSLNTGSFDENFGEVIGGTLAWSGNYKINFDVNEFDNLTILAGINPLGSEYPLAGGGSFTTPEMIYTYSFEGAGGISRNFHDWARNYGIYKGSGYVPTILNSWEGAYFTFNAKTLTDMIDDAADIGLEMFVLDDGWFGNKYQRNDDSAALGDWQVNKNKLPEGINYVSDYANSKGLKFGIWIEPEMVNPKSELSEKHPDWIVKSRGREATTIRNQWLLDLTNPLVQDFIFGVFDDIMKLSPHIHYIKWDANRHMESVGSSYLPMDEQSRFWVDYTQGFYKVLERIRQKYPQVLIQSCASGGGRVDYGALKYFNEVWTSDNTEALSRIYIQYGTSMIYPANVMGSHVSQAPNHQTNNTTPVKFRFDVASAGRLGMELQPKDMIEDEKEFARKAVANYKLYRDIIMSGDLYRIESPYDGKGYYAIMYVSKNKEKAVVFTYCIQFQGRTLKPKFCLKGLNPDINYSITELNVEEPTFWGSDMTFSGSFLINHGINPPLTKIYDSSVFLIEKQ